MPKKKTKTVKRTAKKSKKPASDQKQFVKRSSVRFSPDQGTYALIDTRVDSPTFDPTIPALVFSESHKGSGLVAMMTPLLQVGNIIKVQVGNLPVLKAEIRWREQIDPQVIKLGLMYSE